VSQGRAPLSQLKVRKILDTTHSPRPPHLAPPTPHIPTIRAPIKAPRMQVTEKPRESQMSPLSFMFAVGYCSHNARDDTGH
jgi:hypothetical protein